MLIRITTSEDDGPVGDVNTDSSQDDEHVPDLVVPEERWPWVWLLFHKDCDAYPLQNNRCKVARKLQRVEGDTEAW